MSFTLFCTSYRTKTSFYENTLSDSRAFYNHPDYNDITKQDFSSKFLQITYELHSLNQTTLFPNRIVFNILSSLLVIQKTLQIIAAKLVLFPSSRLLLSTLTQKREGILKNEVDLEEWKYKRITFQVDGHKIDAVIIGKKETLHQKRWVLYSDGQKGTYEGELSKSSELKQILTEIDANALLFNYPSVGASSGFLHRESISKVYRAMLTFLEDQKMGVAAKEIILYGYSMGVAIQGDALLNHPLKNHIHYVRVLKQGFSDLSKTASLFYSRIPLGVGFLIHLLGWNISSVQSLSERTPTIILQTAKLNEEENHRILTDSSSIIHDGVIAKEATLATFLLDNQMTENKVFFGIKETHNQKLKNTRFLTGQINESFRIQNLKHQAI